MQGGEKGGGGDGAPQQRNWNEVSLEDLRVVAAGGDAGAQCALGWIEGNDENAEAAAGWFRKAAEQGHAEAQFHLGACLDFGPGVEQDQTEAVSWYRKAAEQGHAMGQFNLGFCFKYGEGVDQDFSEAVSWYRKAADQGNAMAQFSLGHCFTRGEGVDQDFAEAVSWFRKAADQGNAMAQNWLGICFSNGEGVDQDFAEAVSWYRKAAEQGLAEAQNNLGVCFEHGEGVAEDDPKAASWFRKAAEQGHAEAQHNLGLFFDHRNHQEAASWFRKAAKQGHRMGCESYGMILSEGAGVARDCDEALVWLRKCPHSDSARKHISEIEKLAADLCGLACTPSDFAERIRAGDSVFGTTPEGNTVLHTAAIDLAFESVALMFDHPSFDELVLRANSAGQLARDVVGDHTASERGDTIARLLESVLSCRRSTRVACLLWCLEQTSAVSVSDRRPVLPREIGELIAHFVVPPRGAVTVFQLVPDTDQLAISVRSSWKDAQVCPEDELVRTKRDANAPPDDCEEPESKRARSGV
jgi:TPR repeat protein